MRRTAGSSFSASTYAILILGTMSIFLLYSWVNEARAGPSEDDAKDLLIERLLSSNQQLRRSLDDAKAAPPPSDVIIPYSSKPCICESDEKLAELSVELEILREELAAEKHRRVQAELKLKSNSGNDNVGAVVLGGAADGSVPVPSCRHQKLEFLRFQEGPDGKELRCPFTPINYENWEKLPPLCDYISLECVGQGNLRSASVFGFAGPTLMIGYADVWMWEFVWQRHTKQKTMVELGTMSGGTSVYWGLAARARGGKFHTFDHKDYRASAPKRAWLDNMEQHIEDILTGIDPNRRETHNKVLVDILRTPDAKIALFDNGDKIRETNCYARYLPVGSVLLLHDWEHLDLPKPHWEMTYSYVSVELEARGFRKAYFDFAEHIGSSTRVFIRENEGIGWER